VSLLRECGTAKLLRECGTAKLLRGCPPKDICTEFGLDPSLALKFTWSGALTRCTDCWDINADNHWGCTAAPTSLPNFTDSLSCLGPTAALSSQIRLDFYWDFCGGYQGFIPIYYSDSEATCFWKCTDGVFELLVVGKDHSLVLFYGSAYDVKDGDVLGNQLSCLSVVRDPCANSYLTFPAFVTGGSYKVEIVT
jgi:hypothetical protein